MLCPWQYRRPMEVCTVYLSATGYLFPVTRAQTSDPGAAPVCLFAQAPMEADKLQLSLYGFRQASDDAAW